MNDESIFANSRSGDFRDMQRVENAYRRWERDLPYIKRAAYGRYAAKFCLGKPGVNIDLRHFSGSSEEFYSLVETALQKRFYQPETQRKYLSVLKHFLQWLTVPVNRVNNKCIYAYLDGLLNGKMKPVTYSLYLSGLRTIFDCFCNLEITNDMKLPKLKRSAAGILMEEESSSEISAAVKKVFQGRNSVRDLALLSGLLFLDVKLNELLNIRRKDVLTERKKVIVWGGPGRIEREIELPDLLSPFFTARMNELNEGEYLFSSERNHYNALTGQGANKIIQRMFIAVREDRKINCRILRKSNLESVDILTEDFSERFSEQKRPFVILHKETVQSVGSLKINIGELVSYKGVVSADIEFIIKGDSGEDIRFSGIHISTLNSSKPSLFFPLYEEWEKELLWIPREMKERICSAEFTDRISGIIIQKYLDKKKSCYIRKKRVNAYWKQTG